MKDSIIISYSEIGNNLETRIDFFDEDLNYPLNVYFATKKIIVWETIIESSEIWCSFPYSRNLDVRIIDSNGDLILNKIWTPNSKSDICEIKVYNLGARSSR